MWLCISLSTTSSRFISVVACDRISFLRPNNLPRLLLLCIVLLWAWVRKYLFGTLLSVLWNIYPEVGVIAESHGSSIFNFLMKLHTVFHNGCNNFIIPSTVHKFQLLYIPINTCFLFFKISILMDERWYVIAILFCLFLMISDVERLFYMVVGCLYAICGEMST